MDQDRCPYCGRWFAAYVGAVGRQKHCGSKECRAKHKRAVAAAWRAGDEIWKEARRAKVREWSGASGYYRKWREDHPEYEETNRARTRERMRLLRASRAKREAMVRRPVEYLTGLKLKGGGMFAKQEGWKDVFDGAMDYLVEAAMFAKQRDGGGDYRGAEG
jgi:hypothetical protein